MKVYHALSSRPQREARGLESPRPAAEDGRRGSGAAEPGVQAAAGPAGARSERRHGARRGLPAAEGDATETPQPTLLPPGVSRSQLKALRAPHLRLPPLASERFPAFRRRRLPFAAVVAVAVAVAIGRRVPGPGCRGVLHAGLLSSSPLPLCALCQGLPHSRRAPGARPRPLHSHWLRPFSAAPPCSAIGCSTSLSGTWRGLIQGVFSHSRGVAGSLTLMGRLLAPFPTSWALSSRWSALLLTRCPSALTPSQIATFSGSSSLRLLLHCGLRFPSITDLCPQVLAPEYFPNPASVEGEGWHRRVARDTAGNERLSLSGS